MIQHRPEISAFEMVAHYCTIPAFLVDPNGDLLYYNEPAEILLGRSFAAHGPMHAEEWATIFTPLDTRGVPMLASKLPLMVALTQKRPAHGDFWIKGLDGKRRHLQVTALPIQSTEGQALGAIALFWEAD